MAKSVIVRAGDMLMVKFSFPSIDDNTRHQETAKVSDSLAEENIDNVIWLAYSSNLYPKEHAWGKLGCCLK